MRKGMVCLAGVFAVLCLLVLAVGNAAAAAVPVEGAKFNVDASIADNLKSYQGKRVVVLLDSGKELGGTLKAVSGTHVHLEELDGMDYFDALIRTDRILAVRARFRAPR
jgi:hypothetical protein